MRVKLICIAGVVLLAGCGDMNVRKYLPFGSDNIVQERPRTPANATEYQCSGGKRFYLRNQDGGASVWLILPERELRLDKLGTGDGTRYSKGNTVLQLTAGDATLTDGAATSYTGCKVGGGETAK